MGGRGASSGISKQGNRYGSQYHTVMDASGKPMVYGNVKFVQRNPGARETLMETMTRGRVYVEIDRYDNPMRIVYFDNANKRVKQIDLRHPHAGLQPHVHHGYLHNENDSALGAARLTSKERRLVASALNKWQTKHVGRSDRSRTP